jgi:hypothetical protein
MKVVSYVLWNSRLVWLYLWRKNLVTTFEFCLFGRLYTFWKYTSVSHTKSYRCLCLWLLIITQVRKLPAMPVLFHVVPATSLVFVNSLDVLFSPLLCVCVCVCVCVCDQPRFCLSDGNINFWSVINLHGVSPCMLVSNKIVHHVNLFSDRVSYCEFALSLLR